jgi:hypothetical protein
MNENNVKIYQSESGEWIFEIYCPLDPDERVKDKRVCSGIGSAVSEPLAQKYAADLSDTIWEHYSNGGEASFFLCPRMEE